MNSLFKIVPRLPQALILTLLTSPLAGAALTINFTEGAGLTALRTSTDAVDNARANNFRAGFDAAAAQWSAEFVDSVMLNFTIDVDGTLASNVLGEADSEFVVRAYSNVRTALIADQSSATDASVTANLVNAASLDIRTNDRSGAVVIDTGVSIRNSFLNITRSNAKSIGLLDPNDPGLDALITFNENFNFDFDQSDGISSGQFDFVSIAAHEIGHALGFTSGVDLVDAFSDAGSMAAEDINGPAPGLGDLEDFALFSNLDLLRYSNDSLAVGSDVLDVAFGGTPFLSIDGGMSNLQNLANGAFNGSGTQASHFSSNANILGPSFAPGSLRSFSEADLVAIDAIGFDRVVAVPEPSLAIAWAVIPLMIVRRRQR